VGPAACAVLAEALARSRSLRQLVLRDNPVGRAGARRLLQALQQGERWRPPARPRAERAWAHVVALILLECNC
jgi:hypothetical protein